MVDTKPSNQIKEVYLYTGSLCLSLTGYTLDREKSSGKLMNAECGKVEGIHWLACVCVFIQLISSYTSFTAYCLKPYLTQMYLVVFL